nr:hypothetical protein [Tanacetum cinerariifolium]GFB11306.1 hypothetical protein [Tanacetum cinerariifolium]
MCLCAADYEGALPPKISKAVHPVQRNKVAKAPYQ